MSIYNRFIFLFLSIFALFLAFSMSVKADIKQSNVYIKISKEASGFLALTSVPDLGFNNIQDAKKESKMCTCKYKKNNLKVTDGRNLSDDCDYCVNVSLDKFGKYDYDGSINNKDKVINNNFQLNIGNKKLNSGENCNNEVITNDDLKCDNDKIKLQSKRHIDPGQYVGELNWNLYPTIENVN
ncbi:hypothetical protein DY037_01365 [Apilactobacillus micheneri]|uniref:hypothetical protein n=1 Tax=Apilactobacillus micheneri TaxID=1899430 RepID=UPI00112E8187|nr:hypothetical protein [Apilactobacillus micheneri]TPR39096.1 hypothetical protein DY119_05385 [Apilactobacillus micheneri]TPR50627.1 hypothetical protein DY037_01365 [Apilactobacillus micheneri]